MDTGANETTEARNRQTTDLGQPSVWMTVQDVSELFGIGRQTAYHFVHDLPCTVRVGKSLRINRPGLEEYLKEQRAAELSERAFIEQHRPGWATRQTPEPHFARPTGGKTPKATGRFRNDRER